MKKKKIKKIILIAIIVLLLSIVCIYIYKSNDNIEEKYDEYIIYEGTKGNLEKYDPSMTIDGLEPGENAYYITGKISAKEDKEFSVITYNLYDENNNLIGTAIAGLNNLEKDKIYDFKAISLVKTNDLEKIDHYKLESVELGNN